jgi:small GTP-binding protein
VTPVPRALDDNHARSLLASAQHAARMLEDCDGILAAASRADPLSKYTGALPAPQEKVARDYLGRLHEQLLRALDAAGVQPRPPSINAVYALRTVLTFLDDAFEEMRARYLVGYGPVADDAVRLLDGIVTELQALTHEFDRFLTGASDQAIEARLDRLASVQPLAGDLRELSRLIAEHGLVDLRPSLAIAVDRALEETVDVAIVGRVSSGKSSLLNALVGKERALVAPQPGTTRDYLEVVDTWNGVAVTIIDTAGTRATPDAIEARGIALGEERVAGADVVVVVNEGQGAWDDGVRYGARAIVVRSKADLGGETRGALATSAATGQGLDELRRRVLEVAGVAEREGSEQAFVTTARQQAAAAAARDALAAALAAWREGQVAEVVALELRQAALALAQLRGVEVGDRVLDEVFARFCIGK